MSIVLLFLKEGKVFSWEGGRDKQMERRRKRGRERGRDTQVERRMKGGRKEGNTSHR